MHLPLMTFLYVALFFVIAAVSGILLLLWIVTKSKLLLKSAGCMWIGFGTFIVIICIVDMFNSKVVLDKNDYYGSYIIDREICAGSQADWQYNTYRFEIKENDSIYFHITNKDSVIKTYKGAVSTVALYESERLVLKMEQPTHHIIISNPTTYRKPWHFTLVFESPYYKNVFFKKGEWEPIEN